MCVHVVPHITLTPPTTPSARSNPGGSARSEEQALAQAHKLGYPVMIRPSFVLGGRAMEILYNDADMKRCVRRACCARVCCGCAVRVQQCLLRPGEMMRTTKQHYLRGPLCAVSAASSLKAALPLVARQLQPVLWAPVV